MKGYDEWKLQSLPSDEIPDGHGINTNSTPITCDCGYVLKEEGKITSEDELNFLFDEHIDDVMDEENTFIFEQDVIYFDEDF